MEREQWCKEQSEYHSNMDVCVLYEFLICNNARESVCA